MPDPRPSRVRTPQGTRANVYGDRFEPQTPTPAMGNIIGQSGPMPMMAGYGGSLTSDLAARQEVQTVARSSLVVAERTKAYYDTVTRSADEAMQAQEQMLQRQHAVQRIVAETMESMAQKMERVKETLASIGGETDVLGEQSMTIQQRQAERERRMTEQGIPSAAEMQDRAARGEPIFQGHRAKAQSVLDRIEALKQELAAQEEVPDAHEPSPGALTPSPASTGRVRTTGQMAAEAEVPEAPQTASQRFEQGQRLITDERGQFDVSNLRQTAANRALRFVQEREDDRPQMRQNKRGQYYWSNKPLAPITGDAPPPELWSEMQTNAEGRWYHPSAPLRTYDIPTDEQQSEVGDALRRTATVGVLRNAIGGVARGETGVLGAAAGALPAVARMAPLVGAAYAGGTQLANFAERQREENIEFQRILGGENVEGFRERLRQTGFRWSQRGVMGQQDTDALYMGLTELDLTGTDRDRALDMAVEQFRATGQSVAQSITAVDLALRTGVENFHLMGDALRGVTQTAREVGENAEEMRESFFTNFRQVAQTMQGPAAVVLAEGLTRAQAGLGNQYENMTANPTGQDQMLMQAGLLGLPFGQYEAIVSGYQGPGMPNDPTAGAMVNAQAQQALTQRFATNVLGTQGLEVIERFRAENANTEPTDQAIENLALELTAVNPSGTLAAQQIVQQLGYGNMTGSQAMGFLAENLLGTYNVSGEIEDAAGETARRRMAPGEIAAQREQAAGVGSGLIGLGQVVGVSPGTTRAALGGTQSTPTTDLWQRLGIDIGDNLNTGWTGRLSRSLQWGGSDEGTDMDVRREYLRQAMETGVIDEGIVRLLESDTYDPDRRFAIEVRDNEGNLHERVVTLQEAMRLAPEQLQSGQAAVVAGGGAGGSVADVTGVADDDALDDSDRPVVTDVDAVGQALGEFQRERQDEDRGSTRVVIEAAPYLENFFRFREVPTGSRYTNDARRNRVPPSPDVPHDQMPGGG